MAGPDTKSDWVEGDTIQVAIGQLTNRFTPIQLAAYAMQLANGGVRYKTHLVHSVRSYDGTVETVVEPEVADRLDIDPAILQTVREGMVAVTKNGGTAVSSFRDASYTVAAKTGTAQNGNGDRSDHGPHPGAAAFALTAGCSARSFPGLWQMHEANKKSLAEQGSNSGLQPIWKYAILKLVVCCRRVAAGGSIWV